MVTGVVKPLTAQDGTGFRATPLRWKATSASVRGAAHQRTGLPNQDAALALASRRQDLGSVAIAAVSDGHGSARHFRSQIGSSHAVNLAAGLLQEFLVRVADPAAANAHEQLQELQKKLVTSWRASVEADYQSNRFTTEEIAALVESEGEEGRRAVEADPALAYGATLLAAATLGNSILYLQLGDGDILAVAPEGVTSRPLPEDERLIANQTTSLCMPEAWNEFRTAWIVPERTPALILLSTDGYVNSFRSERDFLQIGADYLQLLRQQGMDAIAEDLPNILSQATQEGSGDDISVALLLGEATSGEEVKKVAASGSAKSEMLHELKQQHAQQQKALSELTDRVEQARRENHRLRRTLLMTLLVVLAAAGVITRHRWMPYLHHDTPEKPHASRRTNPETPRDGHGDLVPSGIKETTPVEDTWQLHIAEQNIPLPKGAQILGGQILGVPAKAGDLYAEVAQDKPGLELINRSHDTWTAATSAGKKSSVKAGEFVILAAGTHITFRSGKSGVLEKGSAPAAQGGGSQ
jgi:hypothetical protein